MIHRQHLKQLIIVPTLKYLDMYSESAVNLLLGTAAQESHLGYYLMQVDAQERPQGPALGIYQMEPATYQDILDTYLLRKDKEILMDQIISEYGDYWHDSRLIYDLQFATVMARLKYWRDSEPLPQPMDIEGLAHIWKRVFNTAGGKGTVEEFVDNYDRYVGRRL